MVEHLIMRMRKEEESKKKKPSDYTRAKWKELFDAGLLEGYEYKYKNSKGVMQPRPSADLLDEINTIDPLWKPPDPKTPGVKPKI